MYEQSLRDKLGVSFTHSSVNRKTDVSRQDVLGERQHARTRAHRSLKNRLQVQRGIVSPVDRDLIGSETISQYSTIDLDCRNRDVAPVTRHAPVFAKQRNEQLTAKQHLVVNRSHTPATREKLRQRTKLAQTHRRCDFSETIVSAGAHVEFTRRIEIAAA